MLVWLVGVCVVVVIAFSAEAAVESLGWTADSRRETSCGYRSVIGRSDPFSLHLTSLMFGSHSQRL